MSPVKGVEYPKTVSLLPFPVKTFCIERIRRTHRNIQEPAEGLRRDLAVGPSEDIVWLEGQMRQKSVTTWRISDPLLPSDRKFLVSDVSKSLHIPCGQVWGKRMVSGISERLRLG